MLCIKCSGVVGSSNKCTVCGRENATVDYQTFTPLPPRSARLIVFMGLTIIMNIAGLILVIYSFIYAEMGLLQQVLFIVSAILMVFEIIVCVFIVMLKKWAALTYIIFSILGSFINVFTLNFIPIIIRALLLYFVFRKDWKLFN